MSYLTEDKIAILGSAGAIGSNMVQTCLTMGLSPNIAMYDPYEKGNQGAAEEMYHCAFPGARVTWSSDIAEALNGAKYIISSGGAPRKEGMTREDLLKGNAEIAAQLGKDIRSYCPDVKFVVIIFNPADITGLVTLVNSGLEPGRVATLAALDSTRLQTALSQHFGIAQDEVTGCRTYGGHGEQMAVFASTARIAGRPLTDIIGSEELSQEDWEAIQGHVRQGGKKIIQLRGRSSFQSPSHQSVLMVKAVIESGGYDWPVGTYVDSEELGFHNVMMAMETTLGSDGVTWQVPSGTDDEMAALRASYDHLVKLRDEVIEMGVLPAIEAWGEVNPNLAALVTT
jgi:malate dehydrogenase